MSVRSRRTSPPGGVRPGASRWSAAPALDGPPVKAIAAPADSAIDTTAAAIAVFLLRNLRNSSSFLTAGRGLRLYGRRLSAVIRPTTAIGSTRTGRPFSPNYGDEEDCLLDAARFRAP